MGYPLRRWLADELPASISSGERLVALEIADQANDETRRAYGKDVLEIVIRRTGYADEKQLGKVLGKLATHGIELRVPVRDKHGQAVTDSRGRVIYACNGHRLEFYIPTAEECPALKAPRLGEHQRSPAGGSNESEAPPAGPEAPPLGAGSSPAWSSKVPPPGDPSPQPPQDSSSLSTPEEEPKEEREDFQREEDPTPTPTVPGVSLDLAERVMAKTTATAAEFVAVMEDARRDGIRTPGPWLRSEAGAENFLERLAALRSAPSTARPGPPGVGDYRQAIRAACDHGTPGGSARCALCRTQAPAQPRRDQAPTADEEHPAEPPTSGERDTAVARLRAQLADKRPRQATTPARLIPAAAETPPAVTAARTYLNQCGDGLHWMSVARKKLGGPTADRDEVAVLAVTLAHEHHDRVPAHS